jgi:hypothetical protein
MGPRVGPVARSVLSHDDRRRARWGAVYARGSVVSDKSNAAVASGGTTRWMEDRCIRWTSKRRAGRWNARRDRLPYLYTHLTTPQGLQTRFRSLSGRLWPVVDTSTATSHAARSTCSSSCWNPASCTTDSAPHSAGGFLRPYPESPSGGYLWRAASIRVR